jgi:hypothetical protein
MDINNASFNTDGRLVKMVENARMYCLISEMARMTLNEPDIFELAEEIHEYFEYGIEPMDTD